VLENVDRAKAAIRAVLEGEPTIQRDELGLRLDAHGRGPAISERAVEAAIADLEVDGEVGLVFVQCPDCEENHLSLTRGGRWNATPAA
jgi:hypothetical protein